MIGPIDQFNSYRLPTKASLFVKTPASLQPLSPTYNIQVIMARLFGNLSRAKNNAQGAIRHGRGPQLDVTSPELMNFATDYLRDTLNTMNASILCCQLSSHQQPPTTWSGPRSSRPMPSSISYEPTASRIVGPPGAGRTFMTTSDRKFGKVQRPVLEIRGSPINTVGRGHK